MQDAPPTSWVPAQHTPSHRAPRGPRPPRRWQRAVLGVAVLAVGTLGVLETRALPRPVPPPPAPVPPTAQPQPVPTTPAPRPLVVLNVDPVTGADANDGSVRSPFRTIQAALEKAAPGTEIKLAAGEYHEQLQTVHDGKPGAPITIKGPETGTDRAGRYKAVLYGTGRVVSIDNSYYTLDGFTIDGQEKLQGTTFPTSIDAMVAFKDSVQRQVEDGRLVYVGASDQSHDIAGITLNDMFLNGGGGECVRLRNSTHDDAITNSVIQYCGLHGKGSGKKRAVYHNGEGVYIGTSPNSDDQPMHANDQSSRIVVAHNVIRTYGSECFDVKENAHDNVFEDNTCVGNTEPAQNEGSNVELRGHGNTVRDNQISDSLGVNLKISSDGGGKYDNGGNVVQGNHLSGAPAAVLFDTSAGQGAWCGNVISTPALIEPDEDNRPPGDMSAPCAP